MMPMVYYPSDMENYGLIAGLLLSHARFAEGHVERDINTGEYLPAGLELCSYINSFPYLNSSEVVANIKHLIDIGVLFRTGGDYVDLVVEKKEEAS